MTYTDGGSMYNSIGLGKGKCNGNSQGLVYLSQRLNIKSIYAEGMSSAGFHAWTYNRLPDEDDWYLTDKLWYTTLGTDTTGNTTNHSVYTNRGYDYPSTAVSVYDSSKYTYPSIWLSLENTSLSIEEGQEIDLLANIESFGTIFSEELSVDNVSVEVKFGEKICNTDTKKLKNGLYTVIYTLEYSNGSLDISRQYEITLSVLEYTAIYDTDGFSLVSVYDGLAEEEDASVYDSSNEIEGYGFNINDGAAKTLDISGYTDNILTLKYSTSLTARTNTWTEANCKISLSIYIDGVLVQTTNSLTAFSEYIDVCVFIPEGSETITFKTNALGSGGNHGTVMDIQFATVAVADGTENNSTIILIVIICTLGVAALFIGGFFIIKKNKSKKIVSKKSPKKEVSKKETAKKEAPKKEVSKKESAKKEVPKKETPKKESAKKEIKKEAPKKEVVKKESVKKEVSKKETPKKESTKKETPKKKS